MRVIVPRHSKLLAGRRQACKGLLSLGVGLAGCESPVEVHPAVSSDTDAAPPLEVQALPEPRLTGAVSIEAVLAARRSVRSWTDEALTTGEIGQLLWAAQGITDPSGKRTAPSAGATYPLEVYVLTSTGIHHYRPAAHELALLSTEDVRAGLPAQTFVAQAPAVFVITAVFARTEERYGGDAERFVHLEAGHAVHGLVLQAVAMDLGATTVGSFDEDELVRLAALPPDHRPIYLVPVGRPA